MNHFIELQAGDDGRVWLMLHSGSRNLGYVIANHHNKVALELCRKWHSQIPNKDLAFFPVGTAEGGAYIRDMTFALQYAVENRRRMMESFQCAVMEAVPEVAFEDEINIHHNYANLEGHKRNVWVHRKGATSAKKNQMGIIPGSMRTSSYIVRGLGNKQSFNSCSHGAGRKMGRMEFNRRTTEEECNKDMEGVFFRGWSKDRKGRPDYSEAPGAYKDIDSVIANEADLVEVVVKLRPLGVVKG